MSNLEISSNNFEKNEVNQELKAVKNLESKLKAAKSNKQKLEAYKEALEDGSPFRSKIDRIRLMGDVDSQNYKKAEVELLQELDGAFEEHKVNPRLDFVLKLDKPVANKATIEVKSPRKALRLASGAVVQNKDLVLDKLTKLPQDPLEFTVRDISKLSAKQKIAILDCFGTQTDSSGLSRVISYYKESLIEGDPPSDTDRVIGKLLNMMNNYRITDLKLDSVLDGGLARAASKRGLDLKKNLDLDLGGVAELNDEVWTSTKDFVGKGLDKFKDAPNGVKGVMLVLGAFVAMTGYNVLSATPEKDSTKKDFRLSQILKYALYAVGGYAAVNAVMDVNKKALPRDYEKLGNLIKAKDYAEFLVGSEPNDQQIENAGAFIESMYNPRVFNMEFAETISMVKNGKSDSAEWVNFVDGKGVDPEKTFGGVKLFIDRYDPASKSKASVYRNLEISSKVRWEMKQVWRKVTVDQKVGNELTYRDVILRFLAIDPEFTFENQRYKGNERIEEERIYDEKQDAVKDLERMYWLDPGTEWVEEKAGNKTFVGFLESLPFSDEIKSIMPDFVSLFHNAQGEVGDVFVNVDEISSKEELNKYMKMTRDNNFNIMKKRVSFRGSDVTLNKGGKISMESKIDTVGMSLATSSIAVPSREQFFEDFKLIDESSGKEIDEKGAGIEIKTLNPNGDPSEPEMILLPEKSQLVARKVVKLEDYVLYGKDIRFK